MQTSGAEDRAKSSTFAYLAQGLAASGISFRFHAKGRSMVPLIQDGDVLQVEPIGSYKLRIADIVLFRKDGEFKAHRILRKKGGVFTTRGDAGMQTDGVVMREQVLGRVVSKECWRTGRMIPLAGWTAREAFRVWQVRAFASQVRNRLLSGFWCFAVLGFVLVSSAVFAQIAVDSVTSGSTSNTGSAAFTLSVSHTTLGANRLMVVGVSLNNSGNAGTTVTRICYGGTGAAGCPLGQSLTPAVLSEANNIMVEMWYVVAPTITTASVVITVNKCGSGNRLGVTAGVITFTAHTGLCCRISRSGGGACNVFLARPNSSVGRASPW
jgi:hypothetical protein